MLTEEKCCLQIHYNDSIKDKVNYIWHDKGYIK